MDPCAKSTPARPERFFTFDTLTGEIRPSSGLTPGRLTKATQMIDDLRLNEHHHLRKRFERLWLVSQSLPDDPDELTPRQTIVARRLVARQTRLSSIT